MNMQNPDQGATQTHDTQGTTTAPPTPNLHIPPPQQQEEDQEQNAQNALNTRPLQNSENEDNTKVDNPGTVLEHMDQPQEEGKG